MRKEMLVTATKSLAVSLGAIVSLLSLSVYAQSAGLALNHFASDPISFDYPAEYSVTDESNTEVQQFRLTRRGSSVQLTIVATRSMVLRADVSAAIENSTEPLIKQIATALGEGKNPLERSSIKTQVGPKEAEGVRLRSSGRSAKTGEVIWLRLGLRLISMAWVTSGADESAGSQLWQTIRSTLKVEAPVVLGNKTGDEPTENAKIEGGVLNGKALALPRPAYPPLARKAHLSGTVTVQVLIDEQGNVTDAHAVDGHPLLQVVCVAAARAAKFSPTFLEDEPVKVTGVIKYNFVPQ